MTRINLLPWREAARRRRQQLFFAQLGAAAVAGLLAVFAAHAYVGHLIDHQEARNQLLEDEIAVLDQRIERIQELDDLRAELVNRMEVVQELEAGRTIIVQLVEALVDTLPDGVYLTSIEQRDGLLVLNGRAESNARVSRYMENLDASPLLRDPELEFIEVDSNGRQRLSRFVMRIHQQDPDGGADANSEEG